MYIYRLLELELQRPKIPLRNRTQCSLLCCILIYKVGLLICLIFIIIFYICVPVPVHVYVYCTCTVPGVHTYIHVCCKYRYRDLHLLMQELKLPSSSPTSPEVRLMFKKKTLRRNPWQCQCERWV